MNIDWKEKIERILYSEIHQGELDDDLPIYGIEKATKELLLLLQEAVREERKKFAQEILNISSDLPENYIGGHSGKLSKINNILLSELKDKE